MTQVPCKISVVIPAKNEEKYISGVLDALFTAIDYFAGKCEVIVVDNGSTDKTGSIALKYGCNVLNVPFTNSIAHMRNIGVESVCGEIIAFLDADCLVDKNWISYCVERLADPKIGLVGTRAVPDMNTATWVEEGWYGLVSGVERPDYPRWIGSSNMFIRRRFFLEIGGFDESLATAEDVQLCNKVSAHFLVCLEKRILTTHLRESKTLRQLVKREVWRGKSSIRQMMISKNKTEELKSIFIPLSIILLCILSLIGMCINNWLKYTSISILFLPVAMMIYKKAICRNVKCFCKIYIVSLVYLFSRSIAIGSELIIIFVNILSKLKTTSLKNI